MSQKIVVIVLLALGALIAFGAFYYEWEKREAVESEPETELLQENVGTEATTSVEEIRTEPEQIAEVIEDEVVEEAVSALPRMRIESAELAVEVAESPEDRRKGLSGRGELAGDTGLLFVFPNADTHGIWMPDMNFSIDILWLDEARSVVHIEENVSPESYPRIFRSSTPAWYVLEVPEGFVRTYGVRIGSVLKDVD